MTPEQELVVKRAEAVARAEAAAKAEADATAQANAAAGVTNEDTGQGSYYQGSGLKEGVRGAGEGLASVLDLPEKGLNFVRNAPALTTNAAIAAAKKATPEQLQARGVDPAIINNMQPEATTAAPDRFAGGYNTLLPPDPEHPVARMVGNVAGPAIVEGLATGGLSIPGALTGLRRGIATTVGTIGGGEGGRLVDQSLGGTGEIGSVVGSVLGGGVAPGLTTQAGWRGMSTAFTDAKSAGRVAVIDRLNKLLPADQQIPISLGLVGNKLAGGIEDATAAQPFAGGPAYSAREAQYLGMDAAGKKIAEGMRGQPSAPEGINPSTMGQGVRDTATAADQAAAIKQEATYGPMKATVGPETVLPPGNLRTALQNQAAGATAGVDLNTPQHFLDLIDQNAARTLPGGAPKVADPALEASLQAQLARAQANLASAKPGTPLHTAASRSVSDLTNAIDANRGPTFQDLIKLRTVSANRLDPATDFTKTSLLDTKSALTDAQKEVALSKGVSPQEFDQVNAEYGRLADQRNIFDKLTDNAGQGEAYNQLFTGTAAQNLDRLRALREHAPDQLRQILADQFEAKMRGQGAGLSPNAETFTATKTGPQWWKGLPHETRQATAPGMTQVDAGALAAAMRSDARRPTRTAPGAGGNTLGLGSIFGNVGNAGTSALAALAGGPVAGLATAVGIPAAAYMTGRMFTNPNFVRRVVNPGPWTKGQSLSRILAASAGGVGPMNYPPSPLDEHGAH